MSVAVTMRGYSLLLLLLLCLAAALLVTFRVLFCATLGQLHLGRRLGSTCCCLPAAPLSMSKESSSSKSIDTIDDKESDINCYANIYPPVQEVQEAISAISAVGDDDAVLTLGLCAGTTSSIDEHTPNDIKRRAYLKLMLQINCFNDSFQQLVNAFENSTSKTLLLEADSSSTLSNSLSSSTKSMSAVSAKSTANTAGTFVLQKRNNENCHRTKVCCPRCLKGWGEEEKNAHFFNYFMTGLSMYPCDKCNLVFGCSSALHKCPLCKSFVPYDMESYHTKVRCTNKLCDKEFGFYMFPDYIEKQINDLKKALVEKRRKIQTVKEARERKLAKGVKEHSVGVGFLQPLRDTCPVCAYDFERNVENFTETDFASHLYNCVVRRNEIKKKEERDRKERLSRSEYPEEKKVKKEVFVSMLFENIRNKRTQAVIDEVLKYPNSVTTMDGHANTALVLACKENCDDLIEFLIDNGSNINHLNDGKYTPLIYCCVNGNLRGISLLLDKGVNVNYIGRFGNNAFLHAAMNSHLDAVALLLTRPPNRPTISSTKASAKEKSSAGDETIVDINCVNNTGLSALLFSINEKHFPLTKFLIQNHANIHQKDCAGNTSLLVACSYHDEDIVNMLLEKGASITDGNNSGYTPFMVACEHGNLRIIQTIYNTGKVKNINEKNKAGNTALILACRFGHIDVVRWLVSACKADTKIKNKESCDAVYYAWRCFHPDIAHYLLELGISAKFDAPKRVFKPRL